MNSSTSCLRTFTAKSSYILPLLLAGLAASLPAQLRAAGCQPAPPGLVGWWPADGNARDLAGTNHGTLQGGATATASGLVGSAFSFDGTNSLVQVPNAPALRPTNLTIEAWVNFSSLDSARSGGVPAGDQYLVFKQNSKSGSFEGYALEKVRLARGDVFSFMVASPAGQEVGVYSSTTISTGLWYHVAALRGTNWLQLYVNGLLEAQTNVTFPQDYGTQAVYFGSSGASFWDAKLKGRLDEVSLYNRALSAAEIADIYAAGASGKCKAVSITSQPQDQMVQPGGTANFSATATGFGTLSFQWRFNGANLPGATGTSLTLSNVQTSNVGNYDVVVTNSFSAATSSVAVLALLSPPSITSQPQSQTIHAGVPASFSVTATGVPAPSFQWYLNGTLLTDNTRISGSGTATLALSNAQFADAGAYYVVATNSSGSATSALATLTVTGFHPINAGLMPLSLGSAAWGDFNNDGRLDILMTGNDSNGVPTIVLYRNDGNGVFTDTAANLPGLFVSGVAWGDYDNDGFLDFAANGLTSDSRGLGLILHNQKNGTFTNVATLFNWSYGGISNTREGAVAWADYDNDGCLDPLFMGVGQNLMHYNPRTRQFEDPGITFPFCHYAACAWGDYDNDGYPDIFAAGQPDSAPLGLFRNTGAGAFTLTNLPLPILVGGSAAWGDFDNDGNLDIAIGGWAYLGPMMTGVYRNLGGTNFTAVITNLPAALMGSLAWGDYDNDGYLDLLIAAPDATRIYHNNGNGTFTDSGDILLGCEDGVAVWGDYDNDGRLDILIMGGGLGGGMAQVFHNDYLRANTPPSAPASLSSHVLGNSATLNWNAATDAQQTGGLSYNVRIGSTPGGSDILGPMADPATGWRRLPALGNAGLRLSRLITNLAAGTYYWSVQAIDHAYAGSTFAPEQSFTVGPPMITRQPVSQAVPLGQPVVFTVMATDPGAMTYQWYFNGSPLVDNGHWVGATSTNLTLSNALASDAGSYKVVVSNSAFAVTSAVAVLTVWMPPGIVVQPQDASAVLGGYAFFSAIVTGAPPPSLQWYFGNSPLTNSTLISGATTNSLSLLNVQAGQAGGYWLRAVNRGGAVTSRVAQLTILFPPTITNQPQSQTVAVGTPVSFSVQAGGTAPLIYQWLFNGSRVAGATTTTLFLPSAQASNQGSYSVVVSNNYGIATSQLASLTVLSPPWITQQPQDQGAVRGFNAVFTVVVQGTTPLSYQWQKDGVPLTDGLQVSGATTASLTISVTGVSDEATYSVVVSNSLGSATSAGAQLLLPPVVAWGWNELGQTNVPLTATNLIAISAGGFHTLGLHPDGTVIVWPNQFDVPPTATNIVAVAGGYNFSLALHADGTVIGWGYGPISIPPSATNVVGIAAGRSHGAALRADGTVVAWGNNNWGQTVVPASASNVVAIAACMEHTLALRADGTIVKWGVDGGWPISPDATNVIAIAPGGSHNLVLRADHTLVAWGLNTSGQVSVPPEATNLLAIAAGSDHSLALCSARSLLAWGSNAHGETNLPANATNVIAISTGDEHGVALVADPFQAFPPSLWRQPADRAALGGDSVVFSVGVRGSPLAQYQWFFNGSPLPGQANPWLWLSNASPDQAGGYAVSVSNDFGAVTSSVATLTVSSPLRFTLQPTNQTVTVNSNLSFTAVAGGVRPISYQWQKDGQNLTDDAHLTGANAGTLNITGAQTNDSGTYCLVVTNTYGSVTSAPAVLSVVVLPAILNPPASQTVLTGTNAVLSVLASGSQLSYHWFFNGAALTDSTHLSGSGSPNLAISNVVLADAGNYTVTVSNLAGVVTSAPAALTVWQLPLITTQPIGRSVALGFPATLTVAGSGTPVPTWQWQLNGADIPGATNSSFSLASVGVADAGTYTVTLSNAAGVAVSAPALLTLGPVATWARSDSGQALIPPGLSNVVMISSGSAHCLALLSDGTVTAWGSNSYGQTNVPAGLSNVVSVAAGGSHSLALRSDGLVFAWGYNNYGQANVPATLSNVVAIAGGGSHSLAVRADGALVTWGNGNYDLATLPTGLHKVVGVAGGGSHSLALLSDGTEVGWGNNNYLQAIIPPTISNAVGSAGGAYHSLACQANGSVVSWGMSIYGQVTNQPPSLTNIVAVAAGDYHSLALRSDGTVVGWGYNNYGQTNIPAALTNVVAIAAGGSQNMALLGDGRPLLTRQPVGGTFYAGRALTLQAAAAGAAPLAFQWQHNGADIPDATNATLLLPALAAGDAGTYQVTVSNALGLAVSRLAPVTLLDGAGPFFLTTLPLVQTNNLSARVALWVSVSGSGRLSYQWRLNGQDIPGATNEELVFDPITLANSGAYAVFVTNAYGALLSPPDTLRVRQIEVWGAAPYRVPDAASNVIAITGSSGPYLVLLNDGTVGSWGGQAGILFTPAWVTNIIAIAAGSAHGLGLRADGTVLAWGTYSYGVTNVPASLNNAVAVAAGIYHSVALRADGTVAAWGYNNNGQTNVPTAATGIVAIASGYYHNLAIRSDGTVIGWGYNTYGQATPPKGLSNIIAVATGYSHSLALKADGTMVAWGYTPSGAMNVPAGLTNVVAIAAGFNHSLALKSDGTAVAWGTYDQPPAYAPSDVANAIQLAGVYNTSMALFGTRAPYVTIQPFSRTLLRCSNSVLVAKAVGAQPMAYQWQFNGSDIPGATTDTLALTNLQFSDAGAYRLVVTNSYGLAASAAAKLLVQVPLSEALDATNLTWNSSGNAPWFGQADTTGDGKSAARSGAIGNGQQSILSTTAIGPGQLSFWWKVSSEQYFDALDFRIGTTTQAVISGEVGWEQRTFTIPSGSQSLTWRYMKDPTYSAGQDAAWVDQVLFVPDPPVIAYQPLGATANMGATVYLSARATGSPPLSYQWFKDGNALQGATASMLTLSTVARRDSGLYFVQVSNPGGSTLSTNALVKVLVPQMLGTPSVQPDGSLLLTSGDADGHPLLPSDLPNFEAQFSADLVNWSSLPGALSPTNGLLQLQDTNRASAPIRFYRIIEH
jgi:alpha-tubulin suppressor-like RCC1 family protein